MKKLIAIMVVLILAAAVFVSGCEKKEAPTTTEQAAPAQEAAPAAPAAPAEPAKK